jgi:UDP-N-acetyl-D-mannosaminuronic acid transferase (WecB/TagA/CpsF family)
LTFLRVVDDLIAAAVVFAVGGVFDVASKQANDIDSTFPKLILKF